MSQTAPADGPAESGEPRCAVHPGRPALDACPTCARPRCAADAQLFGRRCAGCREESLRQERAPDRLERLVRVGVVGVLASVIGAAVQSEYVGARYYSVLMPFIVGAALGEVALALGKPFRGKDFLAIATVLAVLSALYGFHISTTPFGPTGRWLPPVLLAALGPVAWMVFTTPSTKKRPRQDG